MLEKLITICEDTVSRNSPKRKRFKNQRPIIPRHRKILMRKRTKIRRKFLRETHSDRKLCFQNQLTEIEKQLQTSYKSQRDHDEQKAVEAIKNNSKYFYSYARDKYRVQSQVGPLLNAEGNYVTDPSEMASILSAQYKGAFSNPATFSLDLNSPPAQILEDITSNEGHIITAINEVATHSAPGPDRFPAVLLKNCKEILAHPLFLMWRAS